jgi:hypothetical protein
MELTLLSEEELVTAELVLLSEEEVFTEEVVELVPDDTPLLTEDWLLREELAWAALQRALRAWRSFLYLTCKFCLHSTNSFTSVRVLKGWALRYALIAAFFCMVRSSLAS